MYQTRRLVDVPKDKDVISVKLIYKTKQYSYGNVDKYKEIMFVRGLTQYPDIDFNEIFSLVTCMDIVIIVLVVYAQNKWKNYQMDVK